MPAFGKVRVMVWVEVAKLPMMAAWFDPLLKVNHLEIPERFPETTDEAENSS